MAVPKKKTSKAKGTQPPGVGLAGVSAVAEYLPEVRGVQAPPSGVPGMWLVRGARSRLRWPEAILLLTARRASFGLASGSGRCYGG